MPCRPCKVFFAALVHSANTSFDALLLESFISSAKPSPQSGGFAKQALLSVTRCVVLCLAAGDQKRGSTVEMLTNSAKRHLALLCLGEIRRRKDLSLHAGIENFVIESFQSLFEEIKYAASYALGNIAVGNLSKYLPFILDQMDFLNATDRPLVLTGEWVNKFAKASILKST